MKIVYKAGFGVLKFFEKTGGGGGTIYRTPAAQGVGGLFGDLRGRLACWPAHSEERRRRSVRSMAMRIMVVGCSGNPYYGKNGLIYLSVVA